jgi:glutathione synthase/RimK-type ligase-like ATP-grasp enzyme
MTTHSHNWIVRLEKGGSVHHVYGYNFDLNPATAQAIANDKSAVSELLRYGRIPHVEHSLFLQPRLSGYISDQGNWADMLAFAGQYNFKVVCKPNDGTGGEDVFRVSSQPELEEVTQSLFESHRAICLSPFYIIDKEYRVIVLDGQCELVYAKRRPAVVGDGQATVAELIAGRVNAGAIPASVAARAILTNDNLLDKVLDAGERLVLDWRHNLAHGAHPAILTDPSPRRELEELALACAQELNIKFASIDIIETKGQLLILEVNAGVMMEHFTQLAPEGYAIAKKIYAKAVDLMFAEGN